MTTGWTTRLLTGLAEHLATAGIGTWRTTGVYTDGETGILIRAVPPAPDRIVTLAAYPVASPPGMADHTTGVQVRVRAGQDPTGCDDLADAIHDLLDGAHDLTLGGIRISQITRTSYASLGQDGNRRWERSENYAIAAVRPTAHNTD